MQLHQLQLRYDAQEDRVLLRINTTDQSELGFWLTRRVVKGMWLILAKMVEADTDVTQHRDPGAKSAVMAFKQEEAMQRADFNTGFQEQPKAAPLGDEPLLVATVQATPGAEGAWRLRLAPVKGHGIEIAMPEAFLHTLRKMLVDVSEKAEWALDLTNVELPTAQHPPPSRLN